MKQFRITNRDRKRDFKFLGIAYRYDRYVAVFLYRRSPHSPWQVLGYSRESLQIRYESGRAQGYNWEIERAALIKLKRAIKLKASKAWEAPLELAADKWCASNANPGAPAKCQPITDCDFKSSNIQETIALFNERRWLKESLK